ncbi:MAG: hypothetical protein K0Q73_8100, partial [Paenibacillus sp.]|nr:hypothetical protein [Paenibacillus sp.]
ALVTFILFPLKAIQFLIFGIHDSFFGIMYWTAKCLQQCYASDLVAGPSCSKRLCEPTVDVLENNSRFPSILYAYHASWIQLCVLRNEKYADFVTLRNMIAITKIWLSKQLAALLC